MFGKLISIFIVVIFSISLMGESFEFDGEHSFEPVNNVSSGLAITQMRLEASTNSCDDEGCHETGHHCLHHCSGLHSLVYERQFKTRNQPFEMRIKPCWTYNNHYQEPMLHPALKPPLFS